MFIIIGYTLVINSAIEVRKEFVNLNKDISDLFLTLRLKLLSTIESVAIDSSTNQSEGFCFCFEQINDKKW